MKTEIIKQVNIKLDKDDKEPIKKTIALINELLNAGDRCGCSYYEMNDICRGTKEFENIVEFLNDLVYTESIELT